MPRRHRNCISPTHPQIAARVLALWITLGFAQQATAGLQTLAYEEQTVKIGSQRVVVRVPRSFRLALLTDKLDGPRMLSFAANGDLFIGSRSGKVYRLTPPYTTPSVLVELAGYPHSVALRRNEILVARTNGLYRAPYRMGQARVPADSVTLLASLPGGGGHNSRTVRIGPDGRVYVSLGIQGNCSAQYLDNHHAFADRRGGILVLHEGQGTAHWETYAAGLRNPVGFAWHPRTAVLYASNNGPDHLGFDQPPEYLSRIAAGSFHGMPWFQYDGQRLQRDDCIAETPPRPASDVSLPVATFPARSAPLGVTFVSPGALDPTLAADAVVALHGSWATQPDGGFLGRNATRRPPKLVAVRFDQGTAARVDDLVTGFQLPNGDRWARPAGVAIGPDGALYFTSDAGVNGLFRLAGPDLFIAPAQATPP
jgi:glucose/arabinose dehydrogenase